VNKSMSIGVVSYTARPHDKVLMVRLDGFKDLNVNLKVAAKFESEGGKTLTVSEWMRQRSIQFGSSWNSHCRRSAWLQMAE